MIDYYTNHRLLLPETIWLETEDYHKASDICNDLDSQKPSWQTYLDLLALFALESWLKERLPQLDIEAKIDVGQNIYYLQVGDFTITAIAEDNLLDEVVYVSQQQLQNYPTHFYAVLEINEEAEEAIFRGLLRRDILDSYMQDIEGKKANKDYCLPLSWFDTEPNHLLSYCKHLAADAIVLLRKQTDDSFTLQAATTITNTSTKLSEWLKNTVSEGWLAIENLIDPQMNLAFSTRSIAREFKKGKIIDLGIKINKVTMALLVTVKEETEKIGVNIQLYPTDGEKYLPPGIQLTLFSKAGKNLQSVRARDKDNYIQLKPFRGAIGKRFSVEVALEDSKIREYFEL